ncbi:3-oxoadipyl-CoA thiolase [Arsenicicoccus dermatophilus]|uniref:3-oxoadipyl-CoA thiolase n=1 Tax=Arsenicicoccus dermatophilus TaxID=1076331 RepID=UPI0039171926
MTATRTAYIVDGVRTPVGRYGGALAPVRPDDLAAHVIRELRARQGSLDWEQVDDVILGCANQAGEDNRNVARMAALLAELPVQVPGITVNRLCASGLDAVAMAARAIMAGDGDVYVAGGVESMSRAPFVMPKAESAYSRSNAVYDTTIGWRFVNEALQAAYGSDSMPETAQHVADDWQVSREDQDAFAMRSQERAAAAIASGRLAREIAPVTIPQRKGDPVVVDTDEHPRLTSLDTLASLRPLFPDGSVTAGNASGVNDGAAALLVVSGEALERHGLTPLARVDGAAAAGLEPRVMGYGPVPAVRRLLGRKGVDLADVGTIELNEAFASQGLAVLRDLGLADDDPRVNPHGGAIALGHPLGMSGARLALTAAITLHDEGHEHALATMCVGVGQGVAMLLSQP